MDGQMLKYQMFTHRDRQADRQVDRQTDIPTHAHAHTCKIN